MALETYAANGFVGGVRVLESSEVALHRNRLEAAEVTLGALNYLNKVHTVVTSAYELATHPQVLDAVEACIGPDILLYNSTYIIKEPQSDARVAWHQDLTYWGLSDDDAQVSMWLALAPATAQSGCMQFIPGSHMHGPVAHNTKAPDERDGNLLMLGQHIDPAAELDVSSAEHCPLQPGEASFHHGWTVHASSPNVSSDRRIGLNVQYLAAHNALESGAESAILVRGVDRYGNFDSELPASVDFDPATVAAWRAADAKMNENFAHDQTTPQLGDDRP